MSLVPGGPVRIYTQGGDLVAQVDSGQGPELKVTHLQPGVYRAVQEQVTEDGGHLAEFELVVDAGAEFGVLPVGGGAAPAGETPKQRKARLARERRAKKKAA